MGLEQVVAQEPDTVPSRFNAAEYALQKRYRRPGTVPFEKKDWKANTFISLMGGMDMLSNWGEEEFEPGIMAGASLTHRFTATNAVRGTLMMGNFTRKADNEKLSRIGLQADYIFNITASTSGYNPGRFFELLSVVGLGYQMASLEKTRKHVGEAHIGMQLKIHPNPHMDFFIEPRLSFLTDGIDHSLQNRHKYDIAYGGMIGLSYHLKGWKPFGKNIKLLEGDGFLDNTFISMAYGGQFQSSELTKELGITKSMAPVMTLSVGKWMMHQLALRASLFHGSDTWHQKVIEPIVDSEGEILEEGDSFYEGARYMGGRIEAMFNPIHYINDSSRFSANILAGIEMGQMKKYNHRRTASGGYSGLTGGLQLKYRFTDDLALFVEPRATFADYSMKSGEKYQGKYITKNYTDKLFSVSLGVEWRRADEGTRMGRSWNKDLFEPYYFAGGAIGLSTPIQMKRYELKNSYGYQAAAHIGRVISPLSAFRLGGDFGPLTVDIKGGTKKYNLATISLDYMLNVTNLMTEYEPDRKWEAEIFAGLAATMRMKPSLPKPDVPETPEAPEVPEIPEDTPKDPIGFTRATEDGEPNVPTNDSTNGKVDNPAYTEDDLNKSGFHFGAQVGMQLSYKLTPKIKLYIEPKMRFYGKELLMHNNVSGMDVMMSMQLGASYRF